MNGSPALACSASIESLQPVKRLFKCLGALDEDRHAVYALVHDVVNALGGLLNEFLLHEGHRVRQQLPHLREVRLACEGQGSRHIIKPRFQIDSARSDAPCAPHHAILFSQLSVCTLTSARRRRGPRPALKASVGVTRRVLHCCREREDAAGAAHEQKASWTEKCARLHRASSCFSGPL